MTTHAPIGRSRAAASPARRHHAVPPVVIAAIAGAWILAALAQASGEAQLLHQTP